MATNNAFHSPKISVSGLEIVQLYESVKTMLRADSPKT